MITYSPAPDSPHSLTVAIIDDQLVISTYFQSELTSRAQLPFTLAHVLMAAIPSELQAATLQPPTFSNLSPIIPT